MCELILGKPKVWLDGDNLYSSGDHECAHNVSVCPTLAHIKDNNTNFRVMLPTWQTRTDPLSHWCSVWKRQQDEGWRTQCDPYGACVEEVIWKMLLVQGPRSRGVQADLHTRSVNDRRFTQVCAHFLPTSCSPCLCEWELCHFSSPPYFPSWVSP